MNLILMEIDGTTHNLIDYGIKTIDFRVDAPSPRHQTEQIENRHGLILTNTTFDARNMRASFFMQSVDSKEFVLLRNKVISLFDARTEFYIIDERESHKRWKVRTATTYSIEKTSGTGGFFEVEFISFSPFAESIGTTLEPITFRNNQTLLDKGLNLTEKDYIHTTNTFKIFNAGEKIDPRELPLLIKFIGQSSNLTIKNKTNNTQWKYYGTSEPWDEIILDGIKSYKYGSIFRDTNYGVIELEKNWNEFEISGATNFQVKFEHRFYYL